MANQILEPVYRAYIFTADGLARNVDHTVDLAGSTFLTPRDAAVHTDPFKVATKSGISTFQGYLDIPRGRKGHIDPLKRKSDTGQITLTVLDKRTGTANLTRWLTAFLGDDEGRDQVLGLPVYVEESTDGGSTYTGWFTGSIHDVGLNGRLQFDLVCRDNSDAMATPVFVSRPHSSITYADLASVLPTGLVDAYAEFPTVPKIPATVRTQTVIGMGAFKYLEIDHKAVGLTDPTGQALVITQGLMDISSNEQLLGQATLNRMERSRVKVTVTSGGGATGEFLMTLGKGALFGSIMGPFTAITNGQGHHEARAIFVDEVDSSDPAYLAMLADATTVDFHIVPLAEPTKTSPLMIDDVHVVQLWSDIQDGYFGRLDVNGAPVDSFPKDTAAFTALIADESIGTFRGPVPKSGITNEWIEKHICQAYDLAYYLDGDGRVVPLDWRAPASYAGIVTLDNDDIALGSGSPNWGDSLSGSIRELHLKHYLDIPLDPEKTLKDDPATFPTTPATGIGESDRIIVPFPFGRTGLPYRKPHVIECRGYRYMGGDTKAEIYQGRSRAEWIQNRLLEIGQSLESIYGSGVRVATLPCRRTTVADIPPGTLRVVDVDELPDPASNVRGGARVMRCIGRSERGAVLELQMMDLGENSVATVPTLGTLALTASKGLQSITQPITLNGDSERVRMDIAITATSVGTIPVEASPLWHQVQMLDATGDAIVDNLPSGSRIWPRVRTDPGAGDAAKLPSAWVFPTVPAYVDTTGIAVPTGGGSSVLDGSETELTWTVGNADFEVVVALDGDEIARLPSGSDFFLVRGTDASTAYAATVWHEDQFAGSSPKLTINFNSGATPAVCPYPGGIDLLVGDRQ